MNLFEDKMLFKEMLEDGSLDGCYINSVKVLSNNEKLSIVNEKLAMYEEMKSDLFDFTSKNIEQQISSFRKK